MNKIDLNKTNAMIFYYMQIHSQYNTILKPLYMWIGKI